MSKNEKPKGLMMNLVAGGGAGAMESMICHPLDTIKTRLQLQRSVGVCSAKPELSMGTCHILTICFRI